LCKGTVYEKDGELRRVEAIDTTNVSFGAGTFFGIQVVIVIGGMLLGVMSAFVYLKVTKKRADLFPVMQYINPNFKKDSSDE
jgi:hypothetical protein